LGAIIALGVLGVDLGTLGWITTGLSVGIGFGLQELFANFASGIVLTFERSVRPGDIIESQGTRGVVSQVGMRATVIRTADRAEVFVPNKELMTKPLIALTYSDRVARVALNVGVAYDSDIDKTNEILLATVTRHPLILADPAPGAMLTEMGPYSINFIVFGFVTEFGDSFRVKAELYQMVRDALAQQGISIPYPRSEMHIVQEIRAPSDQDQQNAPTPE
jgi:potassium efflux system protein